MTPKEARTVIARIRRNSQDFLTPRALEALDLAVSHLGGAPERDQPIVAGFVGVLCLPMVMYPGRGRARGLWVPQAAEGSVQRSWDRALAFHSLLLEAGPSSGDPFRDFLQQLLGEGWSADPPAGLGPVSLRSERGDRLIFPADSQLMAINTDEATHRAKWGLQFGADEGQLVAHIAPYAAALGLEHSGNIAAIDPKKSPTTISCHNVHDGCYGLTPQLRSMDDLYQWQRALSERLFCQVAVEADPRLRARDAALRWAELDSAARSAWHRWLWTLPGARRLTLAIAGFFANGGAIACPAVAIQGRDGSHPVAKHTFLAESFDHVPTLQRLCAPGLGHGWQQSVSGYATMNPAVLPILEVPRYLSSRPPQGVKVNEFRWITSEHGHYSGDFERESLSFLDHTDHLEKSRSYACDAILSRCNAGSGHRHRAFGPWLIVDNPLSSGPKDRYVIAPPSGHVAACWDPDTEQLEEIAGAYAPVIRPDTSMVAHCAKADIVLLPAQAMQ